MKLYQNVYRDNPCKTCGPPNRHESCHATCEKFANWQKIVEERKETIRANKMKYEIQEQFHAENHDRLQKRYKRKGK